MLLVSHAHIDHVAAVPYLTEKTAFKGRVFMTHPSKAVMRMLISDYLRILPLSAGAGDDSEGSRALYDERDLDRCCEKIELIDYHQARRARADAMSSTPVARARAHDRAFRALSLSVLTRRPLARGVRTRRARRRSSTTASNSGATTRGTSSARRCS